MIEHLLGDEPAPPPPAPHHVDIDLIALTGYLTAKPARYVRTIKGLTGEEKLIAVELQGEGEFQRLRLVFDRAVVEPTFVQSEVPREYAP